MDDWKRLYDEYVASMGELQAAGEWVHGPRDLLQVVGVANAEQPHSAALAWLFDPGARHGLGSRILTQILERGWPDEETPDLAATVVSREILLHKTRADIVVRSGPLVLVIENKIRALERHCQCNDLYQEWTEHEPGSDVRFLFVTLSGYPPSSAHSDDAIAAWRWIGYGSILAALEDALESSGRLVEPGQARRAAEEYAESIRNLVARTPTVSIGRGGEHGDLRR